MLFINTIFLVEKKNKLRLNKHTQLGFYFCCGIIILLWEINVITVFNIKHDMDQTTQP